MSTMRSLFPLFVTCLLAFHSFGAAESVTPAQVDALLASYFEVQEALADDDLPAAKKAAERLADIGHESKAGGDLVSHAKAIAGANAIEAARKAFQPLSGGMEDLVTTVGTSGKVQVHLAHCPMAFGYEGADWLQSSTKIANPYFGDEMLRCGAIQKQLAPAGKSASK